MPEYWCRVHLSAEVSSEAIKLIAEDACRMVAYEHSETSRIHIHLYIQTDVSTDTIKNRFKQAKCPMGKGNEFWSFVTSFKDKYGTWGPVGKCYPVSDSVLTYASKGKLDPFFVKGFTQEELIRHRDRWVERTPETTKQTKLTQYIVKENPKESKLRQEELIKTIISRLGENDARPTTKDIVTMIRQVVIVENKTILGRFKARDYYDTVVAHVNKENWIDAVAHMCGKDFF